MNIILTCVGKFQSYILDNIRQLLLLKHAYIYVITNPQFFVHFDDYANKVFLINVNELPDTYNYIQQNKMDKEFRNGFWELTSARFFYIYECMRKYNIKDVIHLENDVLVYYNVDVLLTLFDKSRIYMPFDSYTRNIASIVYIPNYETLGYVLDYYDMSKNDMENFAKYISSSKVINLPIFSEYANQYSGETPEEFRIKNEIAFVSQHYSRFPYLFDAAAMGQYLGGVDPENIHGDTRGFVNETCVVKYLNYRFVWSNHRTQSDIFQPFLVVNQKLLPIFNLHIHSKTLNHFSSRSRGPFYNPCFTYVSDTSYLCSTHIRPEQYDYVDGVQLYIPCTKSKQWFDIIIPVGPNDSWFIHTHTQYIFQNVLGYRNIYLVSYDDTIQVPGCITVSESIFPFSKNDIGHVEENRRGWYLQQLLKLYSAFVIPDILETYLVIDSDTVFTQPVHFIEKMKYLYGFSDEYHIPYFEHAQRLHYSFIKTNPTMSGIVHYMLFQRKYLKKLFTIVETFHGKPFWRAFVNCIDPTQDSGASEYELYFHFMLRTYPNCIECRQLINSPVSDFNDIPKQTAPVVSFHAYMRTHNNPEMLHLSM
jgi:hypothetical protein